MKRGDVAFDLWPDDPAEEARAKLRRHLHRLLRALPKRNEPWILADELILHWNGGDDAWLDVAAFEAAVRDEARMQEAVEYYAGDLLSPLDDEWIVPIRERLRAAYTTALSSLIARARSQNAFGAALQFVQRLLASDPWREDALRLLMTLRYEAGDRAGALHAFEQFQRRLRMELDVDPMPETLALREQLARNALAAAAPTRSQAPSESAQSLRFVGRGSEMEQLTANWSRAKHGRGRLVLISGEAGIGKTQLAVRLSWLAELDGARVLWGATSFPESVPYQSITETLRSGVSSAPPPLELMQMAALAQLLPELRAQRPDLPALPPVDAASERTRLFEAVALALESMTTSHPLLIVLEDIHWSSAATIAMLEFIARRAPQKSMLIVATYRSEETEPTHRVRELRRRLQGEKALAHIAVGPLVRRDVDELLAKVPALGAGGQFAASLHAICDGNPLFLVQALRDMLESRAPAITSGTLRDLIATRLMRLSAEAAKLAEIAAVIGTSFNVEVLCEAGGWKEAAALGWLDELQVRNLVREAHEAHHVDYIFTHHLIHGAIYESGAPALRALRHKRVARVLEQIYPTRREELAGELARHYEIGGEAETAAAHYLRAARSAQAGHAYIEALDAIGRALDLTTQLKLRAELLLLREAIHAKCGDPSAQERDLTELGLLVGALDDPDFRCVLLDRRVFFDHKRGAAHEEGGHIEELLSCAETLGSQRWRATALRHRARHAIFGGRYAEAQAAIDEALAYFERMGEVEQQLLCYSLSFDLAAQIQSVPIIRATTDRVRSLPTQVAARVMQTVVRAAAAAASSMHAYDESLALHRELLTLSRMNADSEGEAVALAGIAHAALGLFNSPLAREYLELARAAFTRIGYRRGQGNVANFFGWYYKRTGHFERSRAEFVEAHRIFSEIGYERGAIHALLNRCSMENAAEEYATCAEIARGLLESSRSTNNADIEAGILATLGEAERGLGAILESEQHLRAALPFARSAGRASQIADGLCQYALTLLCLERISEAKTCADEAAELCRGGQIFDHPERVFWDAARVHHAAGEWRGAQLLLAEAAELRRQRAATIPDAESRRGFLALRWNREIDAAATHLQWPSRPTAQRRGTSIFVNGFPTKIHS
ncbi:MAG TPA: AAA family ATPase [Candidatus Acidoferrales bacterium]|nr:AAA family ATPase [Candidatus Acidoferrales bacterium]